MQHEPVIPVMGWIAIGVFVAGTLWSVLLWSIGRHIRRQDELVEAVHGKDGLRDQLARLVTASAFDKRAEKIEGALGVLEDEGQQRERRIMEAIQKLAHTVGDENRELRRELSETNRRVDGMSRQRRG